MEENFVVVSLEDKKSKDVAKILSNETARKILEQLSKKRMSITELVSKLKVPISTIQYNIDALKKAEFINDTAYKYSEKGKKILYYEPARKIVILAPRKEEKNIMEKLKTLLIPLGLGLASIGSWLFGAGPALNAGNIQSVPFAEATALAGEAAVPLCRDFAGPVINASFFFIFLAGLFAGLAIVILLLNIWRWKYGKK